VTIVIDALDMPLVGYFVVLEDLGWLWAVIDFGLDFQGAAYARG